MMSVQLNHRIIKSLCGHTSYQRGKTHYRAGKVTFTRFHPDTSVYEATVKGASVSYEVRIEFLRSGEVEAECTCPALDSYDNYCQHIAAVLHDLLDRQHNGSLLPIRSVSPKLGVGDDASAGDRQLTVNVLRLFSEQPQHPGSRRGRFDTRALLDVEFTLSPFSYGHGKYMFGIEIKTGLKRLYIVKKIREFLERIDRRECVAFSRHFTYDPGQHGFQSENDAVIRELIQICRCEKMYMEASNTYPVQAKNRGEERILPIPPFAWEKLLPLLTAAPAVRLVQGESVFEGIRLSDEPLPLHFEFDEAQAAGYRLDVQGLEKLTVMESYGMVLFDGKLVQLPDDQCKRLSELKRMLEAYRTRHVLVAPEQMEPFMVNVIPGLMKLGRIRIAQSVSERVVQTPLKARLYLDRVKDRLLAGLEFQYGDIVINPLEGNGQNRGTDRILLRDGDQERRILELMEQSAFTKTEGGYFLNDEEAEYDFLYHIVPQLEKWLKVYATSAVKARLHKGHTPVKVRADVDERTNWLELRFELDGIPESHIRSLLKSLEEKRRYYRLPNGALLPLESQPFQEISRFMGDLGIRAGDVKGTDIRLPAARALHFIDAKRQGGGVELGKALRRLLEHMRNPDHLDFALPAQLAPVLRDYQKYGFQWMKKLASYRFGGILADDMGLGKTLQSIAFIASVLTEIRERKLPVLVVSPASVTYNWRNELKKFAPQIRAVIADGSRAERLHALQDDFQADVIITSYPLLRRDIHLYSKRSFHTLILDEAQAFKNHATQTAQAVKMLQAENRFALTGTPVENSLEELWSIFDAVFPELFGGRKAFNNLPREAVAGRVRPFLLRRLKTEVAGELPEKIESLQASDLLPDQKKLYAAYLAKLQQETLKHLNEDSFQENRIKILAGLTRLRQLCCHPALFVEGYTGGSAKFEQLLEIVEDCRSAGKRPLIFSQFTEMLGLIKRELGYRGVPFFYLDGSTPGPERMEMCSRFNEGERDLFLISLKAGGTGLNLTGADTVILYDLWWNPAVEDQAVDRSHRIGQKNVVQVIRLVAQGTVEEKMYELQQRKRNLIEEVIQPGHEALSALTEQEVREILMIE